MVSLLLLVRDFVSSDPALIPSSFAHLFSFPPGSQPASRDSSILPLIDRAYAAAQAKVRRVNTRWEASSLSEFESVSRRDNKRQYNRQIKTNQYVRKCRPYSCLITKLWYVVGKKKRKIYICWIVFMHLLLEKSRLRLFMECACARRREEQRRRVMVKNSPRGLWCKWNLSKDQEKEQNKEEQEEKEKDSWFGW